MRLLGAVFVCALYVWVLNLGLGDVITVAACAKREFVAWFARIICIV